MNTTLKRLQTSQCVEIIDDERSIGNGLIVTLKQGWTFDPFDDNRVAGADSVKELRELIASAQKYDGPYTN